MPVGWDDHEFFAVSPRHFEAIMTKTCQILIEGRYNRVLEPEKHYIALKRDFSNLDEVLERLGDEQGIRSMVERAYEEIYLSGRYTYRSLAIDIETALSKQQRERQERGVKSVLAWPLAQLRSHLATSRVERHTHYQRLKQSIKPWVVV
jgi:phytoene dehydrogenase-like protein